MTVEEHINEFDMICRELRTRNHSYKTGSIDVNIMLLTNAIDRLTGQMIILIKELQERKK